MSRLNEELIIGKNPVMEALQSARAINKILISEQINQQTVQKIKQKAKQKNTIVQKVPRQKLDQLTKEKHQGIVAYIAAYEYAELDTVLEKAAAKNEQPFIVILDEMEDPHNLGAILRTADAVGVHGVIIPKRRSVGLTQTVAKASAGAIEHVPVVRVTNIAQTIDRLKEENIWVVGSDEAGADDYRTLAGDMAVALVIGNEGKGVSRLVKEKCDWMVKLPMIGAIPSLNASVAASLFMYEIFRKRDEMSDNV